MSGGTAAPTVDVLDALLDAGHLSELVGRPVRACATRIKPGTLVVLGLADRSGGPDHGRPAGWARVLWPATREKGAKTAERAGRRGHRFVQRTLPGGLLLQAGGIESDPGLANAVRRVRPRVVRELVADPGSVLRHNPLRRVLVRDGGTVVRVSATPDALARPLLVRLAALGLPVPATLDDGRQPHVSVRRFFGDTDLLRTPSTEGARWAGATLARLHAATGALLADGPVGAELRRRRPGPCGPDDTLGELYAGWRSRLESLGASLSQRRSRVGPPPGPDVVLHGDASADQVLVDTARAARQLNDFDRAGLGPAALDLGSWLAVDRIEGVGDGHAFLAGYEAGGGVLPDETHLGLALARGLLLRASAPLRAGDPGWRAAVTARLDDLEEVLG